MSTDARSTRRRSVRLTGMAVTGGGARGLAERTYYAALGRWRLTRSDLLSETVIVSGSPRSGTTWLDEMLGASLGRLKIEEPAHSKRLPKWRSAFGYDARPFRDPDDADPVFADAMGRLLCGAHLGPGIVRRDRRTTLALWSRQAPVTKVVNLNLLLPWLTASLPGLRVVQIVRNPLATVSSQMHFPGSYWESATSLSLPYQRFLATRPFGDVPVEYDHVEETLATTWACEHGWLADNRDRMPEVVWLRYEDLVRDPEAEVRRVCADLGVALPPHIPGEVFRRPSRSVRPGSATFEHRDAVGGYREKLSDEQIERATAVLERFGFPFYGPEEL